MTSSKPPRGTQDPPAMGADEVKRLLADIDALEAHSSPPEHDPPPGAVGEFAYSWFTQGAEQARRNFADVALHVALGDLDVSLTSFAFDYRPDTSVLREQPIQMVDALVLQAERAMPNASAMWGAALGSSRAPAPRRMPRALLEVVARSRAACQECAEIIHDTFQMALDDGDAMHRSNMDPPRPVAPRRRIDAATAADVLPSGWGVPAAPMPSFAMAMSAPPPFDDDEATVPFSHMYCIGASTLSLFSGDLTRSSAEVLVSSDDDTLAMGGGVSRALLRASGHMLRSEADRAIQGAQPSVGDVVVTGAPGMDARFVFHAITLRNIRGRRQPVLIDGSVGAVVRLCVQRAFDLVESLRIRSIAFPVVAAGSARVPYADAMHEMADAIVSRLLISRSPIAVEVYLHDRYARHSDAELVGDFARHVAQRRELLLAPEGDAVRVHSWADEPDVAAPSRATRPGRATDSVADSAEAIPEPRRLQSLVRALGRLDARRSELERAQLGAVVGKEPSEPGQLASLSRLLATLRSRRHAIEQMIDAPAPASDRRAVFVSSTWSDMRVHRAAVRDALGAQGLEFVGMEAILTTPSIPRDATLTYIGRTATYIAVIGWRYGSIDEPTGMSFTELEYVHAVGQHKRVLAFLADESSAIKPADLDADRDGYERLLALREVLASRHGAVTFTDPADLARKVTRALGQSVP